MPDGGAITLRRRRSKFPLARPRGVFEIVADDGEGMPEEGLSPALTSYLERPRAAAHQPRAPPDPALRRRTRQRGRYKKRAVRRHAGASLPPAFRQLGFPSCIVGTEIAHTPSHSDGVFHVVNLATAAPTL